MNKKILTSLEIKLMGNNENQNSNGEKRQKNHNAVSRKIKNETIYQVNQDLNLLHQMREAAFAIHSTKMHLINRVKQNRVGIHAPKNLEQVSRRVKQDTSESYQHGTSRQLHEFLLVLGMTRVTSTKNLLMLRRESIQNQNLQKLHQLK